jgi:hypothetical protein
MALTQIQIIQSLGEAMNWLEHELSWEVAIAEQRHLVGRIGELYAALISNGQMAPETNQAGYDIVSSSNERISVKTTTQASGGHISFNENTLDQVDRVIVLFLNTEEMQIDTLLDASISETQALFSPAKNHKLNLSLSKLRNLSGTKVKPLDEQSILRQAAFQDYIIQELESGSILVFQHKQIIQPAKPALRNLSTTLGLPLLNANGNPMNTRQLGSRVIRQLMENSGN